MKRKQLFALMLAGTLAVGTVPYVAFAEEEPVAEAQSLEEEALEGFSQEAAEESQNSEETPTEEPVQEPTQEPVQEPAAEPTQEEAAPQTPVQEPAAEPELNPGQEAQNSQPTDVPTQAPTATPTEAPTATPTELPEAAAITNAADLQAAIEVAGTEETVIMIDMPDGADSFAADATISVPAGKNIVIIPASGKNVKVKRGDALTGSLFSVADTASLKLSDGMDEADSISGYVPGTMTLDGACTDTPLIAGATGALIRGEASAKVILSGITLVNNIADTALGGAVDMPGGTLKLEDCSISNCNSVYADGEGSVNGGAVYTAGSVEIAGTVEIERDAANPGRGIVLDQAVNPSAMLVINLSASGCRVPFSVIGASAGVQVVELNGRADMVTDGNLVFETMEGQNLTLDTTGSLIEAEEPTPTPTGEPTPIPTGEPTPIPTEEPTPVPTVVPLTIKKAGTTRWISHTQANITFETNKDAKYYYEVYECADQNGAHSYMFDISKANTNVRGGEATTLDVEGFPEGTASGYYDIVLFVRDHDNQTKVSVFHIKDSTRPAAESEATPTPTYAPRIPAVTESTVSGLEKPLAFYPNKFYDFTVTGAGTDNTNPGQGDVKWVPIYWSTSSNPTEAQRNDKWRIGAKNGITQAATFNMYVFFQKWEYDGTQWKATDTVESVVYQFKSQAITITPAGTVTPTADPENGSDTGGSGSGGYTTGSGSDDAAESNDGSSTSTGATARAAAANTADEAPIGNMFLLLTASLLTGGYVIVRRRMKTAK